jgi:transcriptional regulator with XRE-family HTH domain
MTQEELAAELGINVRSLQNYEAGSSLPRPARRRLLLAWLEEHERAAA